MHKINELNPDQLNQLYMEATQVDDEIFAEMRSNILLVSGDHYNNKGSAAARKFWGRLRNTKEVSDEVKLRLTKNHIQNITSKYVANIMYFAPDALIVPNNKEEIQDQKTAEMNNSVWRYDAKRMGFRQKVRDFCESFVELGEVHAKIYFEPNKGNIVGYGPETDEEGNEYVDEMGQPVPDKTKPVFEGKLCIEEVLAFNMLRSPYVQNIEESPYLIVRKMMSKAEIKKLAETHEKKEDILKCVDDSEESFLVFDGDSASYNKEDKMCLVREHYYKPSPETPEGFYYLALRDIILYSGPLPFGIWPFVSKGFNKIKTSARYRSPIKQMRPYQIEINRCASAIATTQITLGDDKIVMSHGSKMSHGGKLAGIRAVNVTGGNTTQVIPGRSGEQYLGYMQSQIEELYAVMNVTEGDPVKDGQLDPYAMLYVSNKNRENFSKYGETFEEFITEVVELYLSLAKEYYDENRVVPIVGRTEQVNMAEFKNSEKMSFRIQVEPVSDDANSMLGKQLSINHIMQYAGNLVNESNLGMLIKNMPLLNDEEMSSDLTMDYDNAKNDMLALERGEMPQLNPYDNSQYIINRLSNRMRKGDFKFLPEQVQAMYQQYMEMHQQNFQQQEQAKMRAQSGYIPVDGPLITVDYYITYEENGETKTKRAKMPQRALEWLEQQMEAQGTSLAAIEEMNRGALAQMQTQQEEQPQPEMQRQPMPV